MNASRYVWPYDCSGPDSDVTMPTLTGSPEAAALADPEAAAAVLLSVAGCPGLLQAAISSSAPTLAVVNRPIDRGRLIRGVLLVEAIRAAHTRCGRRDPGRGRTGRYARCSGRTMCAGNTFRAPYMGGWAMPVPVMRGRFGVCT